MMRTDATEDIVVRKKKQKKKITLEETPPVIDITDGMDEGESLDSFVDGLDESKTKKSKKSQADAAKSLAVDSLKNKIEELEGEIKKLVAENRNQKIRLENEYGKRIEYASEAFFREFIVMKDSFDEAMKHLPEEKKDDENHFGQGIKLLYGTMEQLMTKFKLVSYSALGTTFNPSLHQAMQSIDVEDKEKDEVIAEYQVGYKYGDRILRPSMVVVATGNAPAKQEETDEKEK